VAVDPQLEIDEKKLVAVDNAFATFPFSSSFSATFFVALLLLSSSVVSLSSSRGEYGGGGGGSDIFTTICVYIYIISKVSVIQDI